MRIKPEAERWRWRKCGPYSSNPGDLFGVFMIPGPHSNVLKILASCGDEKVR